MGEYVAMVNGNRDAAMVSRLYADAAGVRLPLAKASRLHQGLPPGTNIWIDGGIDSLHLAESISPACKTYIKGFDQGDSILRDGLSGQCSRSTIERFVTSLLGNCAALTPKWISIPQVPYDTEKLAGRRKLNRDLLTAAAEWTVANPGNAKLMLPVILYQADAANAKMKWRNDIIKHVNWAQRNCNVDGIWVVNCALDDERGSGPNQERRFPGLIALHEELRASIKKGTRVVAGPYWAMNLVLWARRLIDNPVIGIATGYRYYISGGETRAPADRVAVSPLLRRVKATDDLSLWLRKSEKTLSSVATPASRIGAVGSSLNKAAAEIGTLSRQLRRFRGDLAHEQVARFYKDWLDRIETTAAPLRALALRQEFSDANVVGAILTDLPPGNKARKPGRLAEQFMLNCL